MNGNKAKLTPEQRDRIISLYREGVKVESIAAEFGVSKEYPGKLSHRRGEARRKINGAPNGQKR